MSRGSGIARVTVTVPDAPAGARLLLPAGTGTPHDEIAEVTVEGAAIESAVAAAGLDLAALAVRAAGGPVAIHYHVGPASGTYPETMFQPRHNRHTAASDALAEASRAIAADAGGGRRAIEALVAEAEARFHYTHPEIRFTDGLDSVPHLSCGLTPGSCVDINTYLIASLRAAGIEAGYLVGYFFPQEKDGTTHDMHCWVVTRADGETLEWDIAHHIKAGLGRTRPGLNPRPGRRVAVGHSMGHAYALAQGHLETKLLGEPVWIAEGAARAVEGLTIAAA